MRWTVVCCGLMLGGCAGIVESANKASTAFGNLTSAFTSDIELERSLLRDVAYKSAQLNYVSAGTYTCGDPKDPYTQAATLIPLTPAQRTKANEEWETKKTQIVDKLKGQVAGLNLILEYGASLKGILEWHADSKANSDRLKTALDGFKKYAAGEVALGIVAIESGINLFQAGSLVVEDIRLVNLARESDKVLQEAEKKATSGDSIRIMTLDERRAYALWDHCAVERLKWLRQQAPAVRGDEKARAWRLAAAEAKSPVLMFTAEYQTYLNEREAFLSRRPDYKDLVHSIVAANAAIGRAKPGEEVKYILESLTYITGNASKIDDANKQLMADLQKFLETRR